MPALFIWSRCLGYSENLLMPLEAAVQSGRLG
jgi:hypothetical protein